MRARTWVTVFTCWLISGGFSTGARAQSGTSPSFEALRFFGKLRATDAGVVLRLLRPEPIGAQEREEALAVLPESGDLRPDREERAKLAMLDPVLVYHERAQVFEIKVIDVPQAAVALHQRAVLLISRPALRLLSGPEVQAFVAHEIGHEYFWRDFEDTLARGDRQGRQELELKCDGIAILTLVELGLDPGRLTDGLGKLTRFNERLGATANASEYPKLQERLRFMKALRDLRFGLAPSTARSARR